MQNGRYTNGKRSASAGQVCLTSSFSRMMLSFRFTAYGGDENYGAFAVKDILRYLNITSETANNVASRLNDYLANRQNSIDNTVSELLN